MKESWGVVERRLSKGDRREEGRAIIGGCGVEKKLLVGYYWALFIVLNIIR